MTRCLPLLFAILLCQLPFNTRAQQLLHRECGTDQYYQELARTHPALAKERAELVARARAASQNPQLRGSQTVKVIPVVVHIMHDYTPATNISRAKILDGMRMLNEDFNYLNPDTALVVPAFKSRVANVEVEFRLATIDPDGNCTEGITRTYTPLTHSANDNVKSLVRWDPTKYLNIWVAANLSSGAGAYATFPCSPPFMEGIVTRTDRFGFTYSHTVSHEAGHFLGLDHVWGPGPVGVAGNCANDDGIADTPNTIGGSTPVCNLSQVHCGNLVNIQNIMDYGGCLIMFTQGQKAAMQAALQLGCRTSLWSSANLAATGTTGTPAVTCAPVADFNATHTVTCEGGSLQFTDFSYNATVDSTWSWAWSFPGGTPAVSTIQHPQVNYPNPGTYPVTLQATNPAGTDTLIRTGYITVKETTGALQLPVIESFERSGFPAMPNPVLSWNLQSSTPNTWYRHNAAAADSTYSLRIRHQSISQSQKNALVTPNINLAGVTQPVLEFAVAYALPAANPSAADVLRVLISDDCGQTWTLKYARTGTALATTAPTASANFVPTPADWRLETIPLPTSSPYLMIKFESISGGGNFLYLDAVRVTDGSVTGLPANVPLQGLTIFPNPAQEGQATLRYQLLTESPVRLRVLSATGQVVAEHSSRLQPGLQEQPIGQLADRLAPGMYFIELSAGQQKSRVKLAVY